MDSIKIPENDTGTTAFPNPVNMGMTFDAELVEAVGSAIGDEARAIWNAQLVGVSYGINTFSSGKKRGYLGVLYLPMSAPDTH